MKFWELFSIIIFFFLLLFFFEKFPIDVCHCLAYSVRSLTHKKKFHLSTLRQCWELILHEKNLSEETKEILFSMVKKKLKKKKTSEY